MNSDYDTGRYYRVEFDEQYGRFITELSRQTRNNTIYPFKTLVASSCEYDDDALLPYLYGRFRQREVEDEELHIEPQELGAFLDTFEIKEVG